MRLRQVAQRAEDLDRAVAFYEEILGLRMVARFDPPGLAFFDLGTARLLLETGAPSALVYLEVSDVEDSVASLRSHGVPVIGEPHRIFVDVDGAFGDPGIEEWMAFIQDSEGNTVGLLERRRPE